MNHPIPKIIRLAALFLFGGLLAGCAAPVEPVAQAEITPESATNTEDSHLEAYFQGFEGAFVLYDQENNSTLRYNPQRCATRFLPASTFKIVNSLIGLETGVIPDENYVIPWDGTRYPVPSWNRDHNLKTAIQDSVVWYYRELARRVERDQMQAYIDNVGYGNRDISGSVDYFWLDGSLQISADEQVELLKRLERDDLPFSQRSLDIVKEIILLESGEDYKLRGKTGYGEVDGIHTGWFVGYIEKQGRLAFFALNIGGSNSEANGSKAKEIALDILQGLNLLPESDEVP